MRRLLLLTVLAIAPLAACSKSEKTDSAHKEHSDLPEISIADVEAGLKDGSLTVVDCNSASKRKKVGVLAGAILVDEETFTADDLPAAKDRKLVFYCGGPG
jgi:hypothetical protein